MVLSSTTPLLSSPSSITDLQQWVNHINKTFENYLQVDTNLPICIFQLPEAITTDKPESYVPQHIALGPIHHFRTELYSKQEQLKLITARTVLKPYNITSKFDQAVLVTLRKVVPEARCCYDLYFDIDDNTLAWVFALDGLFLLDVLSKETEEGSSMSTFKDVMMVENQIPLVVLVGLMNALQVPFDSSSLFNLLVIFCVARSPLKFSTQKTQLDLDINSSFHLLHCMYHLIINDKLAPTNPFLRYNLRLDVHLEDVENAVQIAQGLFPGANVVLQPVMLILKLPWDKITSLFNKMLGENPTSLEVDIPSASKLARIGKIEFCTTPGGIRDIEFDEGKLAFSLPVLDLKSDSEVILRNLVAYEGLMFKKGTIPNLDFTEYVDLMCGIIDSVKDVKILREKSIIEGGLGDEEIVKLFNGITKSSTEKQNSALRKTVAKVNKHFGNVPRVKVYRYVKKVFLASWKIFAIIFSVVSLVLMIIEGVCQVYRCKGQFALGNSWHGIGNNQLSDF
ncbi:putative UPF0481 protein At3g02645 [Cynara cardunculus var. scolymus]|uniref:putative UPF0481 protein At3g02645 n=1 Tax=Cynara cardunculus var. scolymus TaxID=59895 RepID=UPI000D62CCEE|nr:putative UPF0481 protein At3g02645 [Cynara cardunculus var. scolymus]